MIRSVRTVFVIQFLASNGSTVILFILSLVLSRLLSPSEIGIYSMTAVVIGFAHIFRDFGVGSYIRSCKDLTIDKIRTAMGVLITTSWLLAFFVYASSGFVAKFYRQPGVEEIMEILAFSFLLIPFGAIVQAVLGREMQAGKQAFVTLTSNVIYFVASIILALLGFSYMTMAWAALINIIATISLLQFVRPSGMPWIPSLKGWRNVTSFGIGTVLSSGLNAIDQAFADIFLGRNSTAHAVGIYSRANSTANIINQVSGPTVGYIALPYLSKIHHAGDDMVWALMRAMSYLVGFAWPALLFVGLFSAEIVEFLYGAAWLECAPVIPWLCLALAVKLPFSLSHQALVGIGRPYLPALPLATSLLAKLTAVLLLYDGSLVSFGISVAIGEILSVPVNLMLTYRFLNVKNSDWTNFFRWNFILSISCFLVIAISKQVVTNIPYLSIEIGIASLIVFMGWCFALKLSRHPLTAEFVRLKGFFRDFK
jgi:O-antigen/teichoic acid export membrane protein